MNAEQKVIKTAYEDEGMSPQEIAEDRELDLIAVKTALMQNSSKYRKDCGREEEEVNELNFSKDEQRRVKDALLDIALGAADDNLRFKALTYVRDDAKGRKDAVKNMAGQQFNILYINEQLKKVRSVTDAVKQKAINV